MILFSETRQLEVLTVRFKDTEWTETVQRIIWFDCWTINIVVWIVLKHDPAVKIARTDPVEPLTALFGDSEETMNKGRYGSTQLNTIKLDRCWSSQSSRQNYNWKFKDARYRQLTSLHRQAVLMNIVTHHWTNFEERCENGGLRTLLKTAMIFCTEMRLIRQLFIDLLNRYGSAGFIQHV